jgi:exopolyphosphatase/guanosine-5'-triphosphate,3'-diphosphate pyrophosphatase
MTIHEITAAGIDLGSNTFRLLVANCSAGSLQILAKKMATVRLGRGLEDYGQLHEESIQKGLAVLGSFKETLADYRLQSLRICGTEALRHANNSRHFLHKAEELLQQPIDIISGEEEARLSLAGVLAGFTEPITNPLLLVDVGGGSTELVFAPSPAEKTSVASVGLGVIGLTEKFLDPSQLDLSHLDSLLAEKLNAAFKQLGLINKGGQILIVGCGGTATSMAALDLNLSVYKAPLVHGYVLQNIAVERLWNKLVALPAATRNALPCLGEGRGEILPAGIRIYHVILQLLQENRIRISDTGLLEGILLSSLPHAAA